MLPTKHLYVTDKWGIGYRHTTRLSVTNKKVHSDSYNYTKAHQ